MNDLRFWALFMLAVVVLFVSFLWFCLGPNKVRHDCYAQYGWTGQYSECQIQHGMKI